MNGNEIARAVTLMEGKKISITIAQVKEVLRCLHDLIERKAKYELDVTCYDMILEGLGKRRRRSKGPKGQEVSG